MRRGRPRREDGQVIQGLGQPQARRDTDVLVDRVQVEGSTGPGQRQGHERPADYGHGREDDALRREPHVLWRVQGSGRPLKSMLLWLAVLLATASVARAAQPADPPERTVMLSTGVEMRYVETGDPDGEVVVFVHGYTDTSLSFRPTIESLLTRRPEVRALAVDLRGHGGSSMPPAKECAP